ncbi:uncharacterized protein J4E84_006789 [Alternaria hordeiaustralica]|uniref:uncharacterized protein n=1 Tax=Alternaria hordeiaustralica TaxID=1187925 RepID=UPI0020C20762|nr:uncharacterized protein J4E84_006789 [Alternaria hordeiaustralica]KAI4683949.1 hypothetical protein J4E84_006789 [Alternaria hordeiaustralica]
MSQLSGFNSLPRELRDQIYEDYFAVEGGYVHNHKTNRLITAKGQNIDLNIRLVSRQIAAETRSLALEVNTITFSTVFDEDLRERAGHFNTLLEMIAKLKAVYLLRCSSRSGFVDKEVRDYAEEHFPEFLPVVEALQTSYVANSNSNVWKETPSRSRQFITSTLNTVAKRPCFKDTIERHHYWMRPGSEPGPDPVAVISHEHSPWTLPSSETISAMRETMSPYPVELSRRRQGSYWTGEKYRFSAATMAIAFLGSISTETRLSIRKILLLEDHTSVAWPECHGQGLVTYCQENLKLRIERRVDLWRACLPSASTPLHAITGRALAYLREYKYDRIAASIVSRGEMGHGGVADWIMEALALESLGMPPKSFTLIIDGAAVPENSTQIFNVLQRDAAWQKAYQRCVIDAIDCQNAPIWLASRENNAYIMRGFSEALQAITDDKSSVKCNFSPGLVQDVDQVVAQGRSWNDAEWLVNWREMGELQADIHTSAPLPSWLDIRREDLLDEEGVERV